MTQRYRNASGGLIDRSRPLRFSFDGRALQGYAGDTLASALLANDVRLVARSFRYHRRRGIFAIGAEEPSALVQLGDGAHAQPNSRVTQVELSDGLDVRAQNCWPRLDLDLTAALRAVPALGGAGFYYKTFMRPALLWPLYERAIRRVAGMGRAPDAVDPDRYGRRYAHCDVLAVGAGPAGLAAALAAARSGARVVLIDENAQPGGWLRRERLTLDGAPAMQWVGECVARLQALTNVRVLARTTAFGYYDHNLLALVERLDTPDGTRERLWRLRARQVVLATGSIERPLLFGDNDRIGVMLAGAARGYLNEYAVRCGDRAVVVTSDDAAYRTALDLQAGGVDVAAVIDLRDAVDAKLRAQLAAAGIALHEDQRVVRALGGRRIAAVELARRLPGGARRIPCDLLCVSGGWLPAVHLHAQSGARPVYDERIAAFVPGASKQAERSAGAARGVFALEDCVADGRHAGEAAATAAGHPPAASHGMPAVSPAVAAAAPVDTELLLPPAGTSRVFVDLQNDVTLADIAQATREGYVSVEHLKRYTTLGMGTDQGKTSNLNGFALLAAQRGEPVARIGTTTFRPPYTPVTLSALAGGPPGGDLAPLRRTPLDAEHVALGAVFAPLGLWRRPQCYPVASESTREAVRRETRAVRNSVGLSDVSTLGKLELAGRDVVEFLNRIYINRWDTLPVGRARYGVMLREDGMVFDDGTVSRLDQRRWFMTTTSGNAEAVQQHLEYWLDVVWRDLDVELIPVTEQWGAIAVAGPASRQLLERAGCDTDLSADAFPHMAARSATVAGCPLRLLRLSFSGELAWELYTPAGRSAELWRALRAAGERHGVTPYGMDALEALRIEKGYIGLGAEADGRATPIDLGLARMICHGKAFVGCHGLARPALQAATRLQLVGLEPIDGQSELGEGAQLLPTPQLPAADGAIGHVSSAAWSVTRQRSIALAMLQNGRARHGETVYVADPVRGQPVPVAARVVPPCFYDPDGSRRRD